MGNSELPATVVSVFKTSRRFISCISSDFRSDAQAAIRPFALLRRSPRMCDGYAAKPHELQKRMDRAAAQSAAAREW